MSRSVETAGSVFVTAYAGTEVTDSELNWLESFQPAGVILFANNCTNLTNLRRSIDLVLGSLRHPGLICIDQEGGRVCRIKGSPAEYQSASHYGSLVKSNSLEFAIDAYTRDLRAALSFMAELGINTLLGPVCDLDPRSDHSALVSRTFGADPETVSAFVSATVQSCKEYEFLSCLKHAPGLSSIKSDPHETLDSTDLSAKEFFKSDLLPFEAGVRAGAPMVMTSHFRIPDCDHQPVTFSKSIVQSMIKTPLGDKPVVVTDDLQMGALSEFGSPGEIAFKALNAGHDLLLTRDMTFCEKAIEELSHKVSADQRLSSRISNAADHVHRLHYILDPNPRM